MLDPVGGSLARALVRWEAAAAVAEGSQTALARKTETERWSQCRFLVTAIVCIPASRWRWTERHGLSARVRRRARRQRGQRRRRGTRVMANTVAGAAGPGVGHSAGGHRRGRRRRRVTSAPLSLRSSAPAPRAPRFALVGWCRLTPG